MRDGLIHNTGNANEFARVLDAHLAHDPVSTRSFEEREAEYRRLSDADLWNAFIDRCERLIEVCDAAGDLAPDTEIEWTRRVVGPAFFAEHMREEMVLHRWDVAGDDSASTFSLGQSWMTRHSVDDVGTPLLARGTSGLDLGADQQISGRLRSPGTDDVLLVATAQGNTIELVTPAGDATIESDPAARTLLLWGRRPADSSRWHSQAGPERLQQVRALLSGY